MMNGVSRDGQDNLRVLSAEGIGSRESAYARSEVLAFELRIFRDDAWETDR